MSKKKHCLGIFFLLSAFIASAQDANTESARLLKLSSQLDGTYQVQVVDSRDKTEIPLFIMDSIQAKRHATKTVYFPLKNNVRVMVLPYSEISKKDFKPIPRTANVSSTAVNNK